MIRSIFLASLGSVVMLAGGTSAGAQASTAATPHGVGSCIWNKLSEPIKADFLATYPAEGTYRDVNRAMVRLGRYNNAVQAAGRGCTVVNPPQPWIIRAVASHAIQLGAASALAREPGVSRDQLDAVWRRATDTERNCLRMQAGRRLGLEMPPCADPEYAKTLLQPLNLTRSGDRAQALRFLAATAENQMVEALILRRQGNA